MTSKGWQTWSYCIPCLHVNCSLAIFSPLYLNRSVCILHHSQGDLREKNSFRYLSPHAFLDHSGRLPWRKKIHPSSMLDGKSRFYIHTWMRTWNASFREVDGPPSRRSTTPLSLLFCVLSRCIVPSTSIGYDQIICSIRHPSNIWCSVWYTLNPETSFQILPTPDLVNAWIWQM